MLKKQRIKDIFDEKISKKRIHQEIILKLENKKEKRSILNFAVPVCLIAVICGMYAFNDGNLMLIPNNVNPNSNKTVDKENSNITINKVSGLKDSTLKIDAKIISNVYIPYFDILSNLKIPKDFDGRNYKAIYVKYENTNNYDKLHNYQFSYFSTSSDRNIVIAFSDKNKPLRDYHLNEMGKPSKINNMELVIYQYEKSYMTEFTYGGYNFDIETHNITEQELISLLESIIK